MAGNIKNILWNTIVNQEQNKTRTKQNKNKTRTKQNKTRRMISGLRIHFESVNGPYEWDENNRMRKLQVHRLAVGQCLACPCKLLTGFLDGANNGDKALFVVGLKRENFVESLMFLKPLNNAMCLC